MRILPTSLVILTLVTASLGQATATKPATTKAAATKPTLPFSAESNVIPTTTKPIDCPDIDALIKSIPAELWPDANASHETAVAQGAKITAWAEKNIAGKEIDYAAVKPLMGKRQGGLGLELVYPYPGKEKTLIHLVVNAPKDQEVKETKLVSRGISITNNGTYTVLVFLQWTKS